VRWCPWEVQGHVETSFFLSRPRVYYSASFFPCKPRSGRSQVLGPINWMLAIENE
jgi:hypothetical protein